MRYTGQDTVTIIAAYIAVSISVPVWKRVKNIQPSKQISVLQGCPQAL